MFVHLEKQELKHPEKLANEIRERVALSNSLQFLAGFSGGTLGSVGFKQTLRGTVFTKTIDKLLFLPSARQNKWVASEKGELAFRLFMSNRI